MSNPAAKAKFDMKKEKYMKEKEAEYTFKPQTNQNAKYDSVPAVLGGGQGEEFSANLKKKLKEKQ